MKLKHHGNTIRELKKRIQDSLKNGAGFTLIELLTTMTIIAVLAGLALVSFQGAKKTARDGRRKADLEQIRSALEMCYADTNVYPLTGQIDTSVSCGGKTYLSPISKDPVTNFNYYYTSSGTIYTLCALLEGNAPNNCPGSDCGGGKTCNHKVTNP